MKKLIIEDNQLLMLKCLVQEKIDYCDLCIKNSVIYFQIIGLNVIKGVFCNLLDVLNSSEEYDEDKRKKEVKK